MPDPSSTNLPIDNRFPSFDATGSTTKSSPSYKAKHYHKASLLSNRENVGLRTNVRTPLPPRASNQQEKAPKCYEADDDISIPGRGEYIRLPLEAAKPSGVKYVDVANEQEGGYDKVQALMKDNVQPPNFAPPMLRVAGAGKNGKDLVIHQSEPKPMSMP